jgi:protein-tyrosine-phosphatase
MLPMNTELIFLVMAPEHIEFLRRFFPEARDNVFLVRQFGREKDEDLDPVIEDPIGGSLDVYRATIQLIHEELERILPIIRRLVLERLSWSS